DPTDPTDPVTPTKPVDPTNPTDPTDPTSPTTPDQKQGDVVVHYVDEDGNTLKDDVVDTPTTPVGEDYDTTDNKPKTIKTPDGNTYVLVPSWTKGNETGKVVEGTTHVTYVYKKVAKWVPEIPGVPEKDRPTTTYPFDPEKPDQEIPQIPTNPETDQPVVPHVPGYTPVDPKDKTPLTPVDPKDPTKGYIPPTPEDPGVDTHIPYVPTTSTPDSKKGNVVVHYKTTDGKEIKPPVVDTPESPVDTPYTTTDNKPTTITTPDGKTYKIVPNLTEGPETGKVVPGTTTVTYVYEEVKGDVVVHYVDEKGNTIKEDVVDTPTTSTGTTYDTTDNKPKTIKTPDGNTYVLVPSWTKGSETGKVVEGTTHVTYVYKKVAKWIPEIPGVPEKDRPTTTYPFDPEKPDQETPQIPTNPETNQPVVPHVPGYVPVHPKDKTPLTPVDPKDPTKGYIPPTPEDPGVDTYIPYVPVTNPTPTPNPTPSPTPNQPEAPKYVSSTSKELPKTGDEGNIAALTGLGLLMSVLGLSGRRRKED
ncbi:TPA: MucBP domain-containing protein, partial [Streptococcus suis]